MLGLLIIAHGSRRPEATAQVVDMAARVARLVPDAQRAVIADPETVEGAAVAAAIYARFLDDIAPECLPELSSKR